MFSEKMGGLTSAPWGEGAWGLPPGSVGFQYRPCGFKGNEQPYMYDNFVEKELSDRVAHSDEL